MQMFLILKHVLRWAGVKIAEDLWGEAGELFLGCPNMERPVLWISVILWNCLCVKGCLPNLQNQDGKGFDWSVREGIWVSIEVERRGYWDILRKLPFLPVTICWPEKWIQQMALLWPLNTYQRSISVNSDFFFNVARVKWIVPFLLLYITWAN